MRSPQVAPPPSATSAQTPADPGSPAASCAAHDGPERQPDAAAQANSAAQLNSSAQPNSAAQPSPAVDGAGGLLWGLALAALATVLFLVANGPGQAAPAQRAAPVVAPRDALSPILQSIEALSQREFEPPVDGDSHARQLQAAARGVAAGTLELPELHAASAELALGQSPRLRKRQ